MIGWRKNDFVNMKNTEIDDELMIELSIRNGLKLFPMIIEYCYRSMCKTFLEKVAILLYKSFKYLLGRFYHINTEFLTKLLNYL